MKKAIGLISKATTLHVHHDILYISLPSLHDYGVKIPNFTFRGGPTQDNDFLFFPVLWRGPLEFNSRKMCQHLTNDWTRWNKRDKVWDSANSLFKWRFRSRRRRSCLKLPDKNPDSIVYLSFKNILVPIIHTACQRVHTSSDRNGGVASKKVSHLFYFFFSLLFIEHVTCIEVNNLLISPTTVDPTTLEPLTLLQDNEAASIVSETDTKPPNTVASNRSPPREVSLAASWSMRSSCNRSLWQALWRSLSLTYMSAFSL